MHIRTGIGFDAHNFEDGRSLIVGGVHIPYSRGLAGHSDADVLVHAMIDAIAGVSLYKDVGQLFPDTDPAYKNADSLMLLAETAILTGKARCAIMHIDGVIIAQEPKMAAHIPAMRAKIATAIGVLTENVTIKATTTEHLGFTGRKEGIAAIAVATIGKKVNN